MRLLTGQAGAPTQPEQKRVAQALVRLTFENTFDCKSGGATLALLRALFPGTHGVPDTGAGSSVVEHLTFNQVVDGSIPSRLTK
jgi:hypothetical protein